MAALKAMAGHHRLLLCGGACSIGALASSLELTR